MPCNPNNDGNDSKRRTRKNDNKKNEHYYRNLNIYICRPNKLLKKMGAKSSRRKGKEEKEGDFKAQTSLKVVLLGDGAVGKTSLLTRQVKGLFLTEYIPTVFENRVFESQFKGKSLTIHPWGLFFEFFFFFSFLSLFDGAVGKT